MSAEGAPIEVDIKRYKTLFEKLDVNKDGQIQVEELEKELKAKNVPDKEVSGHAKVSII